MSHAKVKQFGAWVWGGGNICDIVEIGNEAAPPISIFIWIFWLEKGELNSVVFRTLDEMMGA